MPDPSVIVSGIVLVLLKGGIVAVSDVFTPEATSTPAQPAPTPAPAPALTAEIAARA